MTEEKPRGVSPLLIMFLVTGLTGLVMAAAVLLSEERDEPASPFEPQAPQSLEDRQADDFTLPSLDGDAVRLSDFAGRPVFLNFWRTDCPPCAAEMPALEQFVQEQGDDGAVVLAVNQGEQAGAIRDFLDDIEVSDLPVLLDTDSDLLSDYAVPGLPTTYIIDGSGAVVYFKLGAVTLDDLYLYLEDAQSG